MGIYERDFESEFEESDNDFESDFEDEDAIEVRKSSEGRGRGGERNSSKFRESSNTDISKAVGIAVTSTLILQVIAVIIIFISNIIFISLKPRGNYVQLIDGRVVEVGQASQLYRSPQVIRRFIFESIALLFNWNGYKPVESIEDKQSPELDPGIEVEKGRVPTSAFYGSFALREGLRSSLLNEIAGIVPNGLISSGRKDESLSRTTGVPSQGKTSSKPRTQTMAIIDFISNPKQLAAGKWEVDVVATVLEIPEGGNNRELIKFNKRLIIVAVEPITWSEAQQLNYYSPFASIRASGLQIVEIKEIPL